MLRYFTLFTVVLLANAISSSLLWGEEKSLATTKPDSKPNAEPTNDELEQLVRDLPKGTVETFTRSIQPVLMRHCATGGCHSPESKDGLRLFHVPAVTVAGRRITQRNLYSVLSFVDRDDPMHSRLLTVPLAPHGNAKSAIFNEHQISQYKRLFDWTRQLALPTASVAYQEPENFLPTDAPSTAKDQSPPRVLSKAARKAHPLTAKDRNQPDRRDDATDPFDPEVFNQRYAPNKAAKAKKEPPMNTDEHR
jgi:hypothetical protein